MNSIVAKLFLVSTLILTIGCDTGTNPDIDTQVISIQETMLPDLLINGDSVTALNFEIINTGEIPIYNLYVQVRPEPFNSWQHSAQAVGAPLPVGQSDTLTVQMPDRTSHDDYECYTYILSGASSDSRVSGPTEYLEESEGTCG